LRESKASTSAIVVSISGLHENFESTDVLPVESAEGAEIFSDGRLLDSRLVDGDISGSGSQMSLSIEISTRLGRFMNWLRMMTVGKSIRTTLSGGDSEESDAEDELMFDFLSYLWFG
jgi:hypothetical protein